MNHKISDLDVVRAVLANRQRCPGGGLTVNWDAASREASARSLYSRVLQLFPEAKLLFDDQDKSDYARIKLPSNTSLGSWPFASIILSQVDSYVTTAYAPGMPLLLENALLQIFDEEDFKFISFANFCPDLPPEDSIEAWNNWQLENEDIWRALFDYV